MANEELDVRVVTVFADGPGGGNPAPIVLDADHLGDDEMQRIARDSGHESSFVVDPSGTGCDIALRFWVPNHEMSMCGHATIGTVWLLAHLGRFGHAGEVTVHTKSGVVRARITAEGDVTISQPAGRVEPVDEPAPIVEALGLAAADLAGPVVNAATSRTKTLVPLRDPTTLDALTPDPDDVATACGAVDSTGLYPYAPSGERRFDARQFPRSSGYVEDPATGIAAAALAFGLLAAGEADRTSGPLTVRQGRAMGRPSAITVHLDEPDGGCWLGGPVTLDET